MILFFKYFFLFLLIFSINIYSQEFHELEIDKINVKGFVICKNDSNAIPFAHIIEKNAREGTVSNENGNFNINVFIDDTVEISAIGYFTKHIPAIELKKFEGQIYFIMLEEETYTLEEVIIVPYKNYKELKEAILAYKPAEEPGIELNLPDFPKKIPLSAEDGQIKLTFSPVSAIYNLFSKEGRQIAEYNKLIEKKELEKKIEKKYNIVIVKHITGIGNERKILDFMQYCNLSDEFILTSNDYDIYLAINNCYKSYKIKFPNI